MPDQYNLERVEQAFSQPLQRKHDYLVTLVLEGHFSRAQHVAQSIMRDESAREVLRIKLKDGGTVTWETIMGMINESNPRVDTLEVQAPTWYERLLNSD